MIISEDSVLYRTKQAWKYKLALSMGWLALLALIAHLYLSNSVSKPFTTWLVAGGLFSALALFFNFNIKCPNCNASWYWQYLKKPVKGYWGYKFGSMNSCPVCGFEGKSDSEK